jgi:enoyl-CoA hydratase/carnithine racemase
VRAHGCRQRAAGWGSQVEWTATETGASVPLVAISTEFETILVSQEGVAGRITLNRPEKRNALSLELMEELIGSLRTLGADSDVRAIVIEGAGPAFSAGHDLSEMVGRDVAFYQGLFDVCVELMEAIHRVPQPVIAKVHGVATAAGCQLVAACDLAVASEDARFATPGVKIGLFCSTPMVPLSRAIGRKRALEMLVTGDLVDAETARDWGLVNRVVPDGELDGAVAELVDKIARSSPLVIGIGKEAFYAQVELDEHRAYDLTKAVMAMNSMAADAQEGICAFLEKRRPSWKGK